jgi:predicted aminopeptidase
MRKPFYLCFALAMLAPLFQGCQTVHYYRQAIAGQVQIYTSKRPIADVLADPDTSALLRERLQLVLEIREFAGSELGLPPNGHYLHYADLHRRFVVWNLHAAPELSLEPKRWWYPIVGRLKYQGYFSDREAQRYARKLAQQGYDVFIGGVEAYSTLGWFRDPVLSTFIFNDEMALAELLFHELAHQRVFARGDTDFNEAFATAVAQEGLHRWMQTRDGVKEFEKYSLRSQRKEQFVNLVSRARDKLQEIYGEVDQNGSSRQAHSGEILSPGAQRTAKKQILAELRRDYRELKAEWGGSGDYDAWFENSLNNAKLNTVETYYKLVPAFQELLRVQGGDLRKLYREAKVLAALPKVKRHRLLTELRDKAVALEADLESGGRNGSALRRMAITRPQPTFVDLRPCDFRAGERRSPAKREAVGP